MKLDVTIEYGANAIDIPTMRDITTTEYASYIDGDLFFVDHHDVLRAVLGDYPIATTATQVEHLITYLQGVAQRMRSAE
ncbi:hypothetical protein SAMN05216598_3641 [Pseudomonas asplenii]|uniref:Uncharacterized protein n=1 Tax=Pseudomonas asplenii TaxID=53407 RepID=A0A1H1WY48_9PSED|nr:hypothetical protein [Pseudomonas asplenii]SDT01892.1 hypothetical protein SAMN05216598_3641 [Pseudomonas asplenii]